jgi:hypothetical protein
VVNDVFAVGVAVIQWSTQEYSSVERVSDLSPRVECLSLCTLADVIHNTTLRRGYLTAIYANGMATVRWDGDSADSNVSLSEVSGRMQ